MSARNQFRLRAGAAVAAAAVLFAPIVALQSRIDAETRPLAEQEQELFLRSGPLVKKASLGYDSLLADIYWTRVVQYYGSRAGTPGETFPLLGPLLDITTTLDPHLITAYRFGAIFLSEPPPGGAGRSDLTADLIKRGIAANPDEWRLSSDLGFLYYWHLKDYANASAAYLAGSKNPKAPPWMGMMAARIASKAGDIDTSQIIWAQFYKSSQDENVRKNALEHIKGLQALKDEKALDEISGEYRKRFGRFPASTKDLLDAKMIAGIPVDPAGISYAIGADGKSRLDPKSPVLIEIPPKDRGERSPS